MQRMRAYAAMNAPIAQTALKRDFSMSAQPVAAGLHRVRYGRKRHGAQQSNLALGIIPQVLNERTLNGELKS